MVENNPDLRRIMSNSDLANCNSILSVTEVIFSAKFKSVSVAPTEKGSTDRLKENNKNTIRSHKNRDVSFQILETKKGN